MEPKIRLKGFSGEWETHTLSEYFKKVCDKNTKMEYTTVLTNSAEHGVIPQSDFFDHAIANNKNIGGYYIVSPDDFVYNPRVSVTAPVGPINRSLLDYSGVMSPLYLVFKINGINKDYLNIFYKTNKWHNFMKFEGNCGARFDRLSIGDDQFVKMPLTHPKDNDEQQAIADYFQHLDTLIQSTTKKIESLKQVKAASLQSMFPQEGETTPRIRFKEFDGEWNCIEFGSIITECLDKTTTEDEDILLSSAIDGVYLNSELFGHFRGKSNIGYRKLKKNMLILSAQNLHLGNANVNLRFEHGIVSPAYKIYYIHDCNPELLSHWIKREETKKFFLDATTAGASACRKNIVWEDLYKQTLYLPKDELEQQKLASYLTSLTNQITLQTQRLEKLKQIKSACLDNMFV